MKVTNRFDDGNNDWLSATRNDAWPVAYHGVQGDAIYIAPKVAIEKLRKGFNNAFTKSPAIYCTPDFNTALSYAGKNQVGELNKVSFIFQCRVNPKNHTQHSKIVWTVPESSDIRPYGLVLRDQN